MSTKLSNSLAVATLTAICMMAGVARGDEGAGEFYAIAANSAGDGGYAPEALTCQEQRDAAWFLQEMSRTDGENNPQAPATCRAETYAESSAKTD